MTDKIDFAILTPIPEEYAVVVSRLDTPQKPSYQKSPTTSGTIGRFRVVCVLSGKGEAQSGTVLGEVISEFSPRWVLLVGVAGGFPQKGFHKGDVIVARHVYGVTGKITDKGLVRKPDLDFGADLFLLSHAELFAANNKDWQSRVRVPRPDAKPSSNLKADSGYLVSSDFVLENPDAPFLKELLTLVPLADAADMEAAGVGVAVRRAQTERTVGFLMVRGISDEIGEKSQKKARDLWKRYAADTAAAFVEGFLHILPDGPRAEAARNLPAKQRPESVPQPPLLPATPASLTLNITPETSDPSSWVIRPRTIRPLRIRTLPSPLAKREFGYALADFWRFAEGAVERVEERSALEIAPRAVGVVLAPALAPSEQR